MPRTTLSALGFESLTDHDTEAAWVSFLSIGLHHRESQKVKDQFQTLTVEGEDRLYVCDNNVTTLAKDPGAGAIERAHIAFPFKVTLSDSTISRKQTVKLEFDNIDRLLVDVLRVAKYPLQLNYSLGMVLNVWITVTGDVVTAQAKTYGLELFVTDLDLIDVSWNETVITGTLVKDDVLGRAFPSNHPFYEHYNFPGLFGTSIPL
ncbi:MAG: hypothetical protein JRJ45_00510 [Deltaproteobacteria bacterium]|nr:hypothetical protein [Deltaproteobacteria bacterium]